MNLDFLPVSLARNGVLGRGVDVKTSSGITHTILSSKLFALNNCWNFLKTPPTAADPSSISVSIGGSSRFIKFFSPVTSHS
jgi:hypothetical protein